MTKLTFLPGLDALFSLLSDRPSLKPGQTSICEQVIWKGEFHAELRGTYEDLPRHNIP